MTLPKMFGKYQLLQKLGEGATAEVFLARDTEFNREVVLKILKRIFTVDSSHMDDRHLEWFRAESRRMAQLAHPHLPQMLEFHETSESAWIVMTHIPGKSLSQQLEKNTCSQAEVLQMVRDIANGLDYMHTLGFVHRDVKPANIIAAPNGRFFLTDFGLTASPDETDPTQKSNAILGTPPYTAPEIWDDQPALPASDQYALACVVYEAITGQVLFRGSTPQATLKQHLDRQTRQPRPKELAPQTAAVLNRALRKDPAQRYATCTEFANALIKSMLQPPHAAAQPRTPAAIARLRELFNLFLSSNYTSLKKFGEDIKQAFNTFLASAKPQKVSDEKWQAKTEKIRPFLQNLPPFVLGILVAVLVTYLAGKNDSDDDDNSDTFLPPPTDKTSDE